MNNYMDEGNKILELDVNFNLENVFPDDVIESLGMKDSAIEVLLNLLKNGADCVRTTLINFDSRNMNYYWGIGKRYAPVCYEIYSRLFNQGKEPRLPARLVCNRYSAVKCNPDTIIFWSDPDLTQGLFECLKKDGFYGSAAGT